MVFAGSVFAVAYPGCPSVSQWVQFETADAWVNLRGARLLAYAPEVCRDVVGKTILGVGTTGEDEQPVTPR